MRKFRSHFAIGEGDFTVITDVQEIVDRVKTAARDCYEKVERHAAENPVFLASLESTPFSGATPDYPEVVQVMEQVTRPYNIGPMAAVAGAIVDLAFREALKLDPSLLIVEDGGEIMAKTDETITIGLYAGETGLAGKIGFELHPSDTPIGIGTSSATVGHAFSFGEADAATVFADNAAIADAAATYFGNQVKGKDAPASIERSLARLPKFRKHGVRGVFIARNAHVGVAGSVPNFVRIRGSAADLLARKKSVIILDNEEII